MNITEKLKKIDINKSLLNYVIMLLYHFFWNFCTTILFKNNLLITDFLFSIFL